MEDFNPLTIPAVLPREVRRTEEREIDGQLVSGFPTQWQLENEGAHHAWMKANVANTNIRLNQVVAEFGEVYAAITTEAITRANADEALASLITTVEVRIGDAEAAIVTEATARATADSALATLITNLTARVGTAEAAITTEATTRASADTALSTLITNLTSRVGTAEADILTEASTRATQDSALAASISTVSTTVAGHTASISTLQASYDGVAVKFGLVGYVNGVTGGFVFTGVQRNDGGAAFLLEITSNVIINGDLLLNGSLTVSKVSSDARTGRFYIERADLARVTDIQINGWQDYLTLPCSVNGPGAIVTIDAYAFGRADMDGNSWAAGAAYGMRVCRLKGGVYTPISLVFTVAIGATGQMFPALSDEPGAGPVSYVVQHAVSSFGSGIPAGGTFPIGTGQASIRAIVNEI